MNDLLLIIVGIISTVLAKFYYDKKKAETKARKAVIKEKTVEIGNVREVLRQIEQNAKKRRENAAKRFEEWNNNRPNFRKSDGDGPEQ